MKTLLPALALLMFSCSQTPCYAQSIAAQHAGRAHRSALRDWKFWIGEGIIAASVAADAVTTCQGFSKGLAEGSALAHGSQSCKTAALIAMSAGVFYSGMHLLSHKLTNDDPNKYWRALGSFAIPVTVGAIHGHAAIHNFQLNEAADNAAARARLAAPGN